MMSIDELRREREESANAAYIEFIKHIREDKNGLFCFFEGKDSSYYRPRIVNLFKGNYYPIISKGKKRVLKVYELIHNHKEYDKYKKGFFVDRDFDKSIIGLYNPPIFETPCYSIENLYMSLFTFQEILKSEFHLSEVDDSFKVAIKLYESRKQEFHDATLLFNAWYACLKDRRNETGEETGLNLEDTFPSGFIIINLENIIYNYDLDKIKTKFPNARDLSIEDLNKKIEEFKVCDQEKIFRGKYEIEFLNRFLNLLISDSNSQKKYIKTNISYNINLNQILSQLSNYAETPQSLIDYIKLIIE